MLSCTHCGGLLLHYIGALFKETTSLKNFIFTLCFSCRFNAECCVQKAEHGTLVYDILHLRSTSNPSLTNYIQVL
jgi:hypothetical protein